MSDDERMQYWKDEFWKGLSRLYDETLVLRDQIADLRKVAEAHQQVVESHERRLQRLEGERGRELL